MSGGVEFNDKELKKLIKQYSEKMPDIHVGILANDKNIRKGDSSTNAGIGMVHEFGSLDGKIPQNSFLRMPIEQKLASELEYIKREKGASIREVAYQIGVAAVDVIVGAFSSNGYGQWKSKSKKSDILVDTGQLANSINFEVQ